MDLYRILTIVTCLTSMITMIIVIVACLPHIKNGMAVIRDAVLWLTFVLVVAAVGWLGWQGIANRYWPETSRPRVDETLHTTATADPYYPSSTVE